MYVYRERDLNWYTSEKYSMIYIFEEWYGRLAVFDLIPVHPQWWCMYMYLYMYEINVCIYIYIHIYIHKCVLCGAPSSTASSPSSTVMHVYGFIDILVHSVCVRRYVYICIYMLSKSMPELSFLRMARQGMIHLYAHTYMHVCIYIYI